MFARFLIIVAFFCTFTVVGQDSYDKIIEQGVELHDQGKYQDAIKKYDVVLKEDPQNLHALAEKAYSLVATKAYKSAINTCKKALKPKSDDQAALRLVYTTYGNALDLSGKRKDALKIYNEGLQTFPGFYSLHYNKGITQSRMNNIDGAIESFKKSAQAKPDHASSFLVLGRMLEFKNQPIPAMLSYLRFHVIEPESDRAAANFDLLQKLMYSNVVKTGENAVSINVSSEGLKELDSKNKAANNFSGIELILSMQSALNLAENGEEKTQVEILEHKLSSIFSVMEETQNENSGFFWEFLGNYFIELNQEKHTSTLAHLVFANQTDDETNLWFQEHEIPIRQFYDWSGKYNWE